MFADNMAIRGNKAEDLEQQNKHDQTQKKKNKYGSKHRNKIQSHK